MYQRLDPQVLEIPPQFHLEIIPPTKVMCCFLIRLHSTALNIYYYKLCIQEVFHITKARRIMSIDRNKEMEQLTEDFSKVLCSKDRSSQIIDDAIGSSSTSLRRATPKKCKIEDVVKDSVLHFLPAKSLLRFRLVSKVWDQWITSPLFSFHQSYSFRQLSGFFCQYDEGNYRFLSLDDPAYGVPIPALRIIPESISIRSSSGGLLLCQGSNGKNTYYICNPATENWKELPEPELYHEYDSASVLAFEPSVRNMYAHYQVICAVRLFDQPVICFEVYSSARRSWTQSGAVYLESDAICVEFGSSSFSGSGFYMKGTAYWILSSRQVLAFDVENDCYEIMSLPSECPPGGFLTQIHGVPCYIGIMNSTIGEYLIKIYSGMDLASEQIFRVNLDLEYSDEIREYQVLPCFHKGQVFFLVESSVYSYRLSDQRIEVISRNGVCSSWTIVSYLPYVNSLVSVV